MTIDVYPKIKRIAASVAVMSILIGSAASAADLSGSLKDEPYVSPYLSPYYFALRGGLAYTDDTDFTILGTTGVSTSYDDPGYFVSGAIGMDLGRSMGWTGFRTELELLYLENEVDAHSIPALAAAPFNGANAFGDTSALVGLASVYYDIETGSAIRPFLGGGIGYGSVDFDGHGVTPTGVVMNDDGAGFAYHLSAGATVAVAENVTLEAGYRYLSILDVDLSAQPAAGGTNSSTDFDNHLAYVGLRFGF